MDSRTLEKILNSQIFDDSVHEDIRSLQSEEDPHVLGGLLMLFLECLPARLVSIKAAVRSKNAKNLAESSHTLKSSALNVGISRLAAICAQLEEMGEKSKLGEVERYFEALEVEAQKFTQEVKRLPEVIAILSVSQTKKAS